MEDYQKLPAFISAPGGGPGGSLEQEQFDRERAARELALGRRVRSIAAGDLGPVLKRWVASTVVPVADRLREVANCVLAGDASSGAVLLGSPVFGLPDMEGNSRAIRAVLTWFLKEGRGDDMVLAVLGVAIQRCAGSKTPPKLTALLGSSADAARETALGQFLTQVQGAKAMLKVREGDKRAWAQSSKMNAIAHLLGGQVRAALDQQIEVPLRGKSVVNVMMKSGDTRRIDLKPPTPDDWKLLEVCRWTKGEEDHNRGTWMSFAMMVLCAAQAEAGWFDLVKGEREGSPLRGQRGPRRLAHAITLSEQADGAIKRDLDKWLKLGFVSEPMVVSPVDGDYLTVKHRDVAGGRGPMGFKTKARKSASWKAACAGMAETAWTVATGTLEFLDTDLGKELLRRDYGRPIYANRLDADRGQFEVSRDIPSGVLQIIAAYKTLAKKQFYLPIRMDFRGRVYYQPQVVTLQGGDLQKALLCFPDSHPPEPPSPWINDRIALHASACYGGPNKLDKASLEERATWFWEMVVKWKLGATKELLEADEPFQLYTCMDLYTKGQWDRIALQVDGTCNGLQHLAALFRDETSAPFVNLTRGGPRQPADIYGEVGRRVHDRLSVLASGGEPWAARLVSATQVNRKLMKKPVMVLPYGGTRGTIDDAILTGILEQGPQLWPWRYGIADMTNWKRRELGGFEWLGKGSPPALPVYEDFRDGNYGAFQARDLKDHPLLHSDAKKLGGLVWDTITEVLPKPMAAMQTFRDIGKWVGERTLEWDTGVEDNNGDSLWVVQAKAKSERSTLRFKGLHLPGSVRGLQVRIGRDEVDAASHTSGIVANFIHSQDAAHLARTQRQFLRLLGPSTTNSAEGGSSLGRGPTRDTSFGAIHDCFVTRPSQMWALQEALRWAFCRQYTRDPLAQGVTVYDGKTKEARAFGSWYELAEVAGTRFPEDGAWEPTDVMQSKWCFS